MPSEQPNKDKSGGRAPFRWPFHQEAGTELTSPDQLDIAMQISSPASWLALTVMAAILAGGVAWSLFGSIAKEVRSEGLFVYKDARYIDILAREGGYLTELSVRPGDRVTPGQVVARIRPESDPNHATPSGDQQARNDETAMIEVYAPAEGEIVQVISGAGNFIRPGDRLYQMTNRISELSVVAFMAAEQARLIEPGMPVRVWPDLAGRQEFPGLRGVVHDISPFLLSPESLLPIVGKTGLVRRFSRSYDPLLVEIDLIRSAEGDLAWTVDQAVLARVKPGIVANVTVTTSKQRPIVLGIPALRWLWAE